MTVGRVKDFNFPRSGPTQVRGYMRGGQVEKAAGGIVKPPATGIRAPRPASAVKAQKYVQGMATRPGRGPKIGAKLTVAKPPSPKMGALQNASTPLIAPSAPPMPEGMAKGGRMKASGKA